MGRFFAWSVCIAAAFSDKPSQPDKHTSPASLRSIVSPVSSEMAEPCEKPPTMMRFEGIPASTSSATSCEMVRTEASIPASSSCEPAPMSGRERERMSNLQTTGCKVSLVQTRGVKDSGVGGSEWEGGCGGGGGLTSLDEEGNVVSKLG